MSKPSWSIRTIWPSVSRNSPRRAEASPSNWPTEPTLLGSAGTIAANWSFVDGDESFLVIYADNLTTFPLAELMAFHARHAQIASVALFRSPNPSACGVVEMREDGLITGFWEKPANPPGNLCNAGLYVFRREVRQYLPAAIPADRRRPP